MTEFGYIRPTEPLFEEPGLGLVVETTTPDWNVDSAREAEEHRQDLWDAGYYDK